ncbi:MAG: hypothetical protein AAFY08_02225 [Planctomycetota bacterium]
MTSEKVLLRVCPPTLLIVSLLLAIGCQSPGDPDAAAGLYPARQVWAVAPPRNESGSTHVDTARVADHLAHQLELAPGIDVLPVNRTLAAMEALGMPEVVDKNAAIALRRTLGVDALVIGTVTAWEPYTPPKLGLAVELYGNDDRPWFASPETVRALSRAATDQMSRPVAVETHDDQPVTAISGYFDAASPAIRASIQRYATQRGGHDDAAVPWRNYMLSMDLFTEYAATRVRQRLLHAEAGRLAELEAAREGKH